MTALPFLDTNVFLRHLRQDHPDHSPRATAYLLRVERGELQVRTADTVLFETIYTLASFYHLPRADIRLALLPLIGLRGIVLPGKRRWRRALDLFASTNISIADCYHIALAENLKLPEIVSFDRGLDRVPGVRRTEP